MDRNPLSSSEKSVHRERSIRWGAAREPAATSAAATASALAPPPQPAAAGAAAAIAFLGEFGGASSGGGGSGGPSLRYTKTLPSLMTRMLRGFGNLGILTEVLPFAVGKDGLGGTKNRALLDDGLNK